MSSCRCEETFLLHDSVADDYTEHLVADSVEDDGRIVRYHCPLTGRRWTMAFQDDAADGSSMELWQVMTAAELVERLAASEPPEREQTVAWMDDDIEFRVVGGDEIHHGRAAAEEWAARAANDPSFPKARAISVVELSPAEALVLGDVGYRRDDRYVEYRPSAWLVTVRDGKLIRSLWFDSWDEGRRAAGLPGSGGPTGKRIGGWLFAVRSAAAATGRFAPAALRG